MNGYKRQLARAILSRKRTNADRMLIRFAHRMVPDVLREVWDPLGELIANHRIALFAYSDVDLNLSRQRVWGDYWFKQELTTALGKLRYLVVDMEQLPDITIHLFGTPSSVPLHAGHKILWIHSNPDKVTPEILARYDSISCISAPFAEIIRAKGFACNIVQQGTSKKRIRELPIQYDVVFVGNARGELGGKRRIIEDLGNPIYDLKVWGSGYSTLAKRHWAGEYIDNCELSIVYGSSRISLNDHHPAMAENGFINPRVFDILAAGGFCISDQNDAIRDLFGETVPQYKSPEHLRSLIDYYLANDDERKKLAAIGHSIAIQYTWDKVAEALLAGISPDYRG